MSSSVVHKHTFRHTAPLRARLFPLDGGRWLGRNVVRDAGYAVNLVDDARRHARQHFVRHVEPVGSHVVHRLHSPQRDHVGIDTAVSHDTHALHRQQHGERLRCLPVQVCASQLFEEDGICLPELGEALLRDCSQNPDGQPWPRERVAPDRLRRHAQLQAHRADLVLEQLAQGLDQLQLHHVLDAAHVVVRLDGGRRALVRHALDHIWVQRALQQEGGRRVQLGRKVLKHVNERVANDLALALRVLYAAERRQESLACVHAHQVDAQVRLEALHHLLGLVHAQQPVVDEHGVEAVADGARHEHAGHRRVHAAAHGTDHVPVGAHLLLDGANRLRHHIAHGPVSRAAADANHKVAQDGRALGRVRHLRVELKAVHASLGVGDGAMLRVLRDAHVVEALWKLVQLVSVAHPHLERVAQARQQLCTRGAADLADHRVTVLTAL
mmetsp:Transcript_2866/g.8726  ORF Transcript_2866/g.8726 Transcript_2866/m.8726 type:complete len:440 (+) Transcript_2866:367-1686(+)